MFASDLIIANSMQAVAPALRQFLNLPGVVFDAKRHSHIKLGTTK